MLSKADRRARHLAVAHHFEAAGDDELAGAVAAHYVEALRATPAGPDRDALSARARDWLAQAADRAAELGIPAAGAGPQRAGAGDHAGRSGARGDPAGCRASRERRAQARRAARLPPRGRDDPRRPRRRRRRDGGDGLLATALGDHDRVDELQGAGRADAGAARRHDRRCSPVRSTNRPSATSCIFDSDLDGSLAAPRPVAGGLRSRRAWDRFHKALVNRANVLAALGRHRESITLRRGMLAIATEENDLRTAAPCCSGLALEADEWVQAYEHVAGGCRIRPTRWLRRPRDDRAGQCRRVRRGDRSVVDRRRAACRPTVPAGPARITLSDAVLLDAALLAAYRGDHVRRAGGPGRCERRHMRSPPTPRSVAWYRRVRSVLLLTGR